MPETYPIPSYACNLWVSGDDLWIAFPGQGPEGKGHSIRLPASTAGLATAISILKERATAQDLKLGNRGTPTQYEVENDQRYKALVRARAEERAFTSEERNAARDELEALGL